MKRSITMLAIAALVALSQTAQARSNEDLDDILGLQNEDPVEDTLPDAEEPKAAIAKPASSLKKAPVADKTASSGSLEEVDMMRIESEANELDADAYNDLNADVGDEQAQLKSEIARLEKQTRDLKAGAEQSKRRALMEAKKLELKQRQARDSKGRLDMVEEQRRKEERQLSALQQQVKQTEQKAAVAKEKTLKARAQVVAAEKQRKALEKRLKTASAQIDAEKKRQKKMQETRAKLSAKNGRLKTDVKKVERTIERKQSSERKPRRVGQN